MKAWPTSLLVAALGVSLAADVGGACGEDELRKTYRDGGGLSGDEDFHNALERLEGTQIRSVEKNVGGNKVRGYRRPEPSDLG
jgi:hypothetical protein